MSSHRSEDTPQIAKVRSRRKPTGRRAVAIKTHRPLKSSIAAYGLAALLALGGGLLVSESFDQGAVAAPTTSTVVVGNPDLISLLNRDATAPPYLSPASPEVAATAPNPMEVVTAPAEDSPVNALEKVTEPQAALAPRQRPDLLSVPELGISATIVTSPLAGDRLVIPTSEFVGEYTGGVPLNGTQGTTLLVGHVDFPDGSMGAMGPITYAKPGQVIKASDSEGIIHEYRITTVTTYTKRGLPDEVFATTGPRQLALVTCGGPIAYVEGVGMSYRDNVVVMAVPVA